MSKPIVIIGCGSAKRELASGQCVPIVELYTGSLYKARSVYAEALGGAEFVLSAAFGLVPAEYEATTYECDLRKQSKRDREAWTDKVLGMVRRSVPKDARVIVLAAGPYLDWVAWARREGWNIETPTAGMTLGESIGWLRREAESIAVELIDVAGLASEVEDEWDTWSDTEEATMPVAVLRELVRRAVARAQTEERAA